MVSVMLFGSEVLNPPCYSAPGVGGGRDDGGRISTHAGESTQGMDRSAETGKTDGRRTVSREKQLGAPRQTTGTCVQLLLCCCCCLFCCCCCWLINIAGHSRGEITHYIYISGGGGGRARVCVCVCVCVCV